MDIYAYEHIVKGLENFNELKDKPFGNTVVQIAPTKPTYPLTVVDEIRNIAIKNYNTEYGKFSNLGFRVDIFAKTKGKISKQTIAREISELVDEYFSSIGLTRVSFNISELENDSSIYHIILTFSGTLNEYRRKFI